MILAIACYCLFNDNRNGDDSLDFVPIHTRCPNSPPSTVSMNMDSHASYQHNNSVSNDSERERPISSSTFDHVTYTGNVRHFSEMNSGGGGVGIWGGSSIFKTLKVEE